MLCQVCKQNDASVHVTEVNQVFHPDPQGGKEIAKLSAQERHLCEACAQAAKLPHQPAGGVAEIWKLLQASQQKRQKRETAGLTCPECGMTLRDFRQRGRLGCAKDYEVFGAQLRDLLERIHGATQHVGRRPGGDDEDQRRVQRILELRAALDAAIRDEAYEAAAKLRDELKSLQA
ncbi:MAG: UvrB/UvrC motif-containing protein [Planctomycetes bacterium]|nr:UvrB/UvrC motif-containing protein [Planctomycetota bacterium]